jgi:hypothetical protein
VLRGRWQAGKLGVPRSTGGPKINWGSQDQLGVPRSTGGPKTMKTLAEFTKTTLIGGVLIILPIYVAVLLLAKAVNGLMALLAPVTAQIPAGGPVPADYRHPCADCDLLRRRPGGTHRPRFARQKRVRARGPGKAPRLHLPAWAGQTANRRGTGEETCELNVSISSIPRRTPPSPAHSILAGRSIRRWQACWRWRR